MKPLNNKNNSALQCSSLTSCFIAIAARKLNKKEKLALAFIAQSEEKKSATKTAKTLTMQLACAESTAWATLRSLRELNLIMYDEEQSVLTLSRPAKMFTRCTHD